MHHTCSNHSCAMQCNYKPILVILQFTHCNAFVCSCARHCSSCKILICNLSFVEWILVQYFCSKLFKSYTAIHCSLCNSLQLSAVQSFWSAICALCNSLGWNQMLVQFRQFYSVQCLELKCPPCNIGIYRVKVFEGKNWKSQSCTQRAQIWSRVCSDGDGDVFWCVNRWNAAAPAGVIGPCWDSPPHQGSIPG